ncbi:MAG: hypothetical protein HKN31_06590 [Pricia sp.]|nr:hypothetical protein [Pricia sp.]
MYFKISNTAEKEILEQWAGASLKHPHLYTPQVVINGLNEVTLPIITTEEQHTISLAIWGMLPENYNDDWIVFQNTANTLNLHEESMDSDLWYVDALKNQRALIPVTGFFTSYLRNGDSYPYFIGLKSGRPFYLAGIYTTLADGFITCSLLVGKANAFIRKYQNVVDCMPLTIPKNGKDEWLDQRTPHSKIRQILKSPATNDFYANPIAKDLFHNNITYDSMLRPYEYFGS